MGKCLKLLIIYFQGVLLRFIQLFNAFCGSQFNSVECSTLGEMFTMEPLSSFLWCSVGVVHHGPGLRPRRAGLLIHLDSHHWLMLHLILEHAPPCLLKSHSEAPSYRCSSWNKHFLGALWWIP